MNQHTKETIKGTVRDILQGAVNALGAEWYTVPELLPQLPAKTPESTVARALRKLHQEGLVIKQRDPSNYRYKRWQAAPTNQLSFVVTTGRTGYGPHLSNAPRQGTPLQGDPTMEIEKAVEQILVTEFLAANKPFSAHDVTTAVRQAVDAGTITVDQAIVGTVYTTRPVAKIEHGAVKGAVDALYRAGKLPGYTQGYAQGAKGTYRVFEPAAALPPPALPVPAPLVSTADLNDPDFSDDN